MQTMLPGFGTGGRSRTEASGTPIIVEGDRLLLRRLVRNLLENARRYAGDGPIELSVKPESGRAVLEVRDHGPGVAPQDRERALQRFVRLEKSRSRPGSGLGLSLVAAVARLHGGSIRLEDNAPGLRAVLTLPIRRPTAHAAGAAATPLSAGGG